MSNDSRVYISRRRTPRRAICRKVGMLVSGGYEVCTATEIGEGGMMVCSNSKLAKDQRMVLSFNVEGYSFVIVSATIRYAVEKPSKFGKYQYGVHFDRIDFETRREIRNFVASGPNEQVAV